MSVARAFPKKTVSLSDFHITGIYSGLWVVCCWTDNWRNSDSRRSII